MDNNNKFKDNKQEIINKYNKTSHFYDKRYTKIQHQKYEHILYDYLITNKIILDAGGGTGLLYKFIIDHLTKEINPHFSYISNDISWNMLMIFLSKIKNVKQINSNVNLVLSDMENLPFRDSAFHSIFSLTSIQNLSNKSKGVLEMFRVVKKHGDIKFSILKKETDLEQLLSLIKPRINDIEIIKNEHIEDIMIQGKALKN